MTKEEIQARRDAIVDWVDAELETKFADDRIMTNTQMYKFLANLNNKQAHKYDDLVMEIIGGMDDD